MFMPRTRLMRHLTVVIVVKILLLTALWWAFFRDAQAPVDSERVAEHFTQSTSTSGASQ